MFSKISQVIIQKLLRWPFIASVVINRLTNSARPRPSPSSLWTARPALPPSASKEEKAAAEKIYLNSVGDYTTWVGLFDQTYTKRHLPPASKEFVNSLPPVKDLLELFRRKQPIPSSDNASGNVSKTTSVLFPFFAQWFTDSFLRTDFPDWHKNTSNQQIDMCQIYGLNEAVTNALRAHEGGKLKSQMINGDEYQPFLCEKDSIGNVIIKPEFQKMLNMESALEIFDNVFVPQSKIDAEEQKRRKLEFFAAGLNRANSSIGYTVMNTIFLRMHNQVCKKLADTYKHWDDERLFQTARNIIIVILIRIVVLDYIKHISGGIICAMPPIGFAEKQKWYRPNWMALEFSLLYRWHILMPDKLALTLNQIPNTDYKDFMYNPSSVIKHGLASLITAWSQQPAGACGLFNTPQFLMYVKELSLELSRRARLKSFNEYRKAFGSKELASFDELNTTEESRQALRKLYNNDINKLEFLLGLWAEQPSLPLCPSLTGLYGNMFGSSMLTMVGVDAFSQALTNPLLSENVYGEATFSTEGLKIINSISTLEQLVNETVPQAANQYVSFRLAS